MTAATPAMMAAAWAAWRTRHKDRIGPGPGFREAIEAAFVVYEQERAKQPVAITKPEQPGDAGER